MSYTIAWLVIVLAGLLGSTFLFFITRRISSASLRWIVRVVPLLLLVAPAPVPDYPGQLAPAFVVLTFESLFQSNGDPTTSGLILLATLLLAIAIGLLIGRIASPALAETAAEDAG